MYSVGQVSTTIVNVGTFRGDLLIEGGLHSTTLDAGIFADVFDGDVIATGVIDNIITSGDFIGELDVFGSVGTLSVGGNWCLPACAQSGKLTVSVVEDDPQLATGIGSVFVQGDFPHGNEAVASVLTPVVGSWNTGRFRGGVATSLPDPNNPPPAGTGIFEDFLVRGDYIMPGEPYLTTNSTNLKWLGATGGITIMGSMKSESDSLSTFQITDFPAFIKIGGSFSEAGDISIFIVSSAVLGWPNQMTINALNSGGTWNANSYVRAVTQTLTPLYNTLPGEFADGAVGEVPFTVHDEASDFYNLESDNVTPAPTWSEFNNDSDCDQDVIVEFYGPVRVTDDPAYTGGPVLSVVFNDPLPQGGIDTELSHLMRFTIVGTTPTGKRQVRIDALPGNHLPWGTYTVRNWRDGRVKPLVCDDLLTAAEVAVRDFECSFVLANDCADANGDFDCVLDADCGIVFPYTLCDSIDFNNDGLFPDTTDVSDFIQVFGGGACSTNVCNDIDFNNDGLFPDTMDIQAFLSVFSGGGCVI